MIEGYGYTPTYTRTELTDRLHGLFGIYTDPQIIKKAKIEISYIKQNKNITIFHYKTKT